MGQRAGRAGHGAALLVILLAKFVEGAWLTIVVIPLTLLLLRLTRHYYDTLDRQLQPAELTRQTIAREIEGAFAAEASSGPIWLPATIFVVAARRPVSMR